MKDSREELCFCLGSHSFIAMVQTPDLGNCYNPPRPGRLNDPVNNVACRPVARSPDFKSD
jgi:hypothetical protein